MLEEALKEDVVQNLKDAGCDDEKIERFMSCANQGDVTRGLELLEEHREILLEQVHSEERQISCLDYLIYKIKKR